MSKIYIYMYISTVFVFLLHFVVQSGVRQVLGMMCHLTGYTGNLRYSNTADKVQILFDIYFQCFEQSFHGRGP